MQGIMLNNKYGLESASIGENPTKTQTRRIFTKALIDEYFEKYWQSASLDVTPISMTDYLMQHTRYKVGEIIAVKQSVETMIGELQNPNFACNYEHYEQRCDKARALLEKYGTMSPAFTNKMFVANEDCIHFLKIIDVRIQHLQDISNEDCVCEGIYKDLEGGRTIGYPFGIPFYYTFVGALSKQTKKQLYWTTAKEAYSVLIDTISGKGTWESNPWAAAYTYKQAIYNK